MKSFKVKAWSLFLLLAMLVSLIPAMPAQAKKPVEDLAMKSMLGEETPEDEVISVIVQLKENSVQASALKSAKGRNNRMKNNKAKQNKFKNKIKKQGKKFKEKESFTLLINAFSADMTRAEAEKLAEDPEVLSVQRDIEYLAPEPQEEIKMIKSLDLVSARQAWNLGFRGEKQVVAVLDSGSDYLHPDYKLSDDANGKYTQTEMEGMITSNGLAGKVYSSKVIYGYNYADNNTEIKELTNASGMHGMHVGGTVAANGTIEGVAPEAQLMVMKVFSDAGGGTRSAIYVKAMEDAIKLGADSMNMSLGSPAGTSKDLDTALLTAIDNAAKIGCVVNIAAGNEGYFGEGFGHPMADAPDYGVVGTPSIANRSLSVAALNNTHVHLQAIELADGSYMGYKISGELMPTFNQPYDVVYCGLGTVEDFAGKDLTGKVALVERGSINFTEKIKNSADAGAVAVIVFNHAEGGDAYFGMVTDGATIPAIAITHTDGRKLADNPQTISFLEEAKPFVSTTAGYMADFSSWGLSTEEGFKPEITAPGGNIYSTLNDGEYGDMSGTSMATPHVAGGVALINQRMDKEFPDIQGEAKHQLIKNLLMSTAIPHEDPDTKALTSPRKQGAGVMNLNGASLGHVTVVEPTSQVTKINLKDIGSSFTLKAELYNFGKEAVTYSYDTVVNTDDVAAGEFTLKPKFLKAIPGGSVTVEPGAKVQVEVAVDASEFHDELIAAMPNGYYLDGFIRFTSDTAGPVSIPYVGFRGNWNDIPVLEKSIYDFNLPEETPFYYDGELANFTHFFSKVGDQVYILGQNPNGEKLYDGSKITISPNGDGKFDDLTLRGTFLRNWKDTKIIVYEPGNPTPIHTSYSSVFNYGRKNHYSSNPKWEKSTSSASWNWNGLKSYEAVPDGTYEVHVSTTPDIAEGTPQITKYNVMVDTQAPKLTNVVYDEATGALTFDAVDLTSGVMSQKVTLADGTVIEKDEAGRYMIPLGTDLSTVLITVRDFGLNEFKNSVVNAMTPGLEASITVKGVTTDGSYRPSFKYEIRNEKGELQLNPNELAYGTYTVTLTEIAKDYACDEPVKTVTLTLENPDQEVVFSFYENKIPTGEIVVIMETLGDAYPNPIELVAVDAEGKEFPLTQYEFIPTWYTVDVPYGTYTVEFRNLAEGWKVLPDRIEGFVVDSSYPPMINMTLSQGEGGTIAPVAVSMDGADVSGISFEAYDQAGNPADLSQVLPYNGYTVYPVNLPEDCYVVPQYLDLELTPENNALTPEFKVYKSNGARGSIAINTIPAKDSYTDLDVEYKVTDFYGNVYTDLNNLPMGTYYVAPKEVPIAYSVKPQVLEVVLTPDAPTATADFTYTKLSDSGLSGGFQISLTGMPTTIGMTLKWEVENEAGEITTYTMDRMNSYGLQVKVPYGVYKVRCVDVPAGYYLEPEEMLVRVDSPFGFAFFDMIKGEKPTKTITKLAELEPIQVAFGTPLADITLPEKIEVTLSDASTMEVPVKWNTEAAAYDPTQAGSYTITGDLDLTGLEVTNPENLTASQTIVVAAEESHALEITEFEGIPAITVTEGTAFAELPLPRGVNASLSDGSTTILPIAWDASQYDMNQLGEQMLTATLYLPEDGSIVNSQKLKVQVKIMVEEKVEEPEEPLTIVAVDPITMMVPNKTKPKKFNLPKKVTVRLSNGESREVGVKWTLILEDTYGANGGEYIYSGSLILPEDVTNPDGLKTDLKVIVQAKPSQGKPGKPGKPGKGKN